MHCKGNSLLAVLYIIISCTTTAISIFWHYPRTPIGVLALSAEPYTIINCTLVQFYCRFSWINPENQVRHVKNRWYAKFGLKLWCPGILSAIFLNRHAFETLNQGFHLRYQTSKLSACIGNLNSVELSTKPFKLKYFLAESQELVGQVKKILSFTYTIFLILIDVLKTATMLLFYFAQLRLLLFCCT